MNTVVGECPHCGDRIVWFSKAGEVQEATFHIFDVPYEIAVDIHGKWTCCRRCENVFMPKLPWGFENIMMQIRGI